MTSNDLAADGGHSHALDTADLLAIWRVLKARWFFITSFVALAATLALLVAYSLPPLYRATVTIILEPEKSQVSNVNAIFTENEFNYIYYETQRNLITSRDVLNKVVDRLALADEVLFRPPVEAPWWQVDWRMLLPFIPEPPQVELSPLEEQKRLQDYAVAKLAGSVTVVAVPATELMKINVSLESPQLAELVANELAGVYIESGLEARFSKARQANKWVGERLQKLKAQLEISESKLQGFLAANKLTDVGGIRGLVEADIQQNTANFLTARKTVAILKNVVGKIERAAGSPQMLEDIQRIVSDPVVRDTRRGYLSAKQQVNTLGSRYGPKHPKMITAKSAEDEAKSAYHQQLLAVAANVTTEYQLAKQAVRDLSGFTNENKQQLTKLDGQAYELRVLQRDVDADSQMYDLFLAKMKETDISGEFDSVNARVVEPAEVPRAAYKPQKKKIVVIVALLAGLLASGLVVLAHLFDTRIATPDYYKSLVAPFGSLGSLPEHAAGKWSSGQKALMKLLTKERGFVESLRSIRTGLQLGEVDRKNKVIAVVSAVPGEGKTTVSLGLAHVFSQLERVLLIETDLRKPSIEKRLNGSERGAGLMSYLLGNSELEQAIVRNEELGFDVLSAGAIPPNPQEIIQSNKFAEMLDLLRQEYDRVILDTAPVLAVSDAHLLAKSTDGFVFITRANETHRMSVIDALNRLGTNPDTKILGCVLNGIDTSKLAKYYGKQYAEYYDYYA